MECSPAIAYGRVFIGSDDNYTYCLNATNGTKLWSYKTGGLVESSPAFAGGYLFVGSWNGMVYCFNATTGAKIWSYKASDVVFSSPAVASGRVYVGCDDNAVYCLNATTGEKLWSYTTGDWVESSVALANGRVYVGSRDSKVYCLPMELIFPPEAPLALSAIGGDGNVSLTWREPLHDGGSVINACKVYRGTSPGNAALLVTLGNVMAFFDTSTTNGQVYYYQVSAVNEVGEGPRSTQVSVTPRATPLHDAPPVSPATVYLVVGGVAGGALAIVGIVVFKKRKQHARQVKDVKAPDSINAAI